MIRKSIAAIVAVATLVATPALAYEGGWYFDNNPGGWEQLSLGDNSDDTYLHLEGTRLYCGRRGVPYAKMRNIIARNGDEQLTWWIDESCDNTVRVCIENWRGESACSTYWWLGWSDYQ